MIYLKPFIVRRSQSGVAARRWLSLCYISDLVGEATGVPEATAALVAEVEADPAAAATLPAALLPTALGAVAGKMGAAANEAIHALPAALAAALLPTALGAIPRKVVTAAVEALHHDAVLIGLTRNFFLEQLGSLLARNTSRNDVLLPQTEPNLA